MKSIAYMILLGLGAAIIAGIALGIAISVAVAVVGFIY